MKELLKQAYEGGAWKALEDLGFAKEAGAKEKLLELLGQVSKTGPLPGITTPGAGLLGAGESAARAVGGAGKAIPRSKEELGALLKRLVGTTGKEAPMYAGTEFAPAIAPSGLMGAGQAAGRAGLGAGAELGGAAAGLSPLAKILGAAGVGGVGLGGAAIS